MFKNNSSYNNHFYINIQINVLKSILKYIKFETILNNSYISDTTAFQISNTNINNINKLFKNKIKNKIILIYSLYNPLNYTRLSLLTLYSNNNLISSFENFYKNLNWLERELTEFFNIKYINKTDTRNLLLDYNDSNNYLLKTYNTELSTDLYYNLLNDNLSETQNQNTNI